MVIQVQIVVDCADPARLAAFWSAALDYTVQGPPAGFASWPEFLTSTGVPESEFNSAGAVVDPDKQGPRIYFQRVPEPKQGKNRLHLDLNVAGGQRVPIAERKPRIDDQIARLTALGAELVSPVEENGEYWVVMRDPEGNEFCLQ